MSISSSYLYKPLLSGSVGWFLPLQYKISAKLKMRGAMEMARVSIQRYTACPGLRIHSLPKRADASVAPEFCLICCTATWGATKIVLKRAGIHRSTNCSVSGEVKARIH